MSENIKTSATPWKEGEKILFRFFFIYFFIQSVPVDWNYFKEVFSINWLHLHYGDIFNLTRYAPRFFSSTDSFYNWGIVVLISLIGLVVWTVVDNKSKEYNLLYYWIRVIVRYRLAIGIIGYGFHQQFEYTVWRFLRLESFLIKLWYCPGL